MLKEFNRDQSLVWEKNPNYWREGQPYLDGIEVTIIPDADDGLCAHAGRAGGHLADGRRSEPSPR